MPPESLTLRPATPADLPAVAELFLSARAAAVPAMPPIVHPPEQARARIRGWDLERQETWVAVDTELAGYAVLDGGFLDALYVDPARQRDGIGSALLDLVKSRCPDGFELWVFESNLPARSFYARHGLIDLERTDGSGNQERAADRKLAWPGADPVAFLRGRIDAVDTELAELLGRRAALSAAIQDRKPVPGHAGRDPRREQEIAERMAAHAPGLGEEAMSRIMHTVIAESLDAWERRTR